MSGIEVAGLVLGIVPLVVSVFETSVSDWEDFGLVAAIGLRLGLFEARSTVGQIRASFINGNGGPDEAIAYKDSYAPGLNMIGVAGAIIAQIALTALGLPDLNQTHWTAQAAFVVSLVSGCFAVFFSCVLQRQLSSLRNEYAVRRWLTRPRETWQSLNKLSLFSTRLQDQEQHLHEDKELRLGDLRRKVDKLSDEVTGTFYRPSLSAALILTAPSQLLNVALGFLLIGFGIYFGIVWSSALPGINGHNAALATLATYTAFTIFCLLLFYGPMLIKAVAEIRDNSETGDTMTQLQNLTEILRRRETELATDGQSARAGGATSGLTDLGDRLDRIAAKQEEQVNVLKDLLTAIQSSRV